MTPTHDQLVANIKAMESQGAPPQDIQAYLDKFKGQTPGQPMTIPQQSPLTPDQGANALGHSNSFMSKMIGGLGTVADTAGQIGTGVALGAAKTLESADVLNTMHKLGGEKTLQDVTGADITKVQPQGTLQQVGQAGERIGEFFVPGGAEKKAIAKGSELLSGLPKAAQMVGKTAIGAAVPATSMGVITQAQTGDVQQAKGAFELGGVAGAASRLLETFGPQLSNALNKADFRLSPAKEAKTQKIADQAAQFITTNKILGTESTKYKKLSSLTSQMESALQTSLPKDVAAPKSKVIDHINSTVEALRDADPADYQKARNVADNAIAILQQREGETIPVKDLLLGKRSWGSEAFKLTSKGKIDPTVSNTGAYAAEQAYQGVLESVLESSGSTIKIPPALQKVAGSSEMKLSDFNKIYSAAINAKNLTGIAQYKNDAGLFGRLFGLWVGKSIGSAIAPGLLGEILGAGAGEAASTHIPGAVRNVAERLLAKPQAPVVGAKVLQGTTNQNPEGQN